MLVILNEAIGEEVCSPVLKLSGLHIHIALEDLLILLSSCQAQSCELILQIFFLLGQERFEVVHVESFVFAPNLIVLVVLEDLVLVL